MLYESHNSLGNNGTTQYYWKDLKRISVEVCKILFAMSNSKFKDSKLCAILLGDTSNSDRLHFNEFVSPFEATIKEHQFALTVICMLTNYVICVLLTDKSGEITVANAYIREV